MDQDDNDENGFVGYLFLLFLLKTRSVCSLYLKHKINQLVATGSQPYIGSCSFVGKLVIYNCFNGTIKEVQYEKLRSSQRVFEVTP